MRVTSNLRAPEYPHHAGLDRLGALADVNAYDARERARFIPVRHDRRRGKGEAAPHGG
jgi:hypothetical protein